MLIKRLSLWQTDDAIIEGERMAESQMAIDILYP